MHDDVLAGDIGIHLSADLRVAEFGLSIDPRRQGRGLGTEAVQALVSLLLRHTPVATIVAATDARNLPCLRMLDKAGLRMTGERMAVFKGEACMEHVRSEEHTSELQSLMRCSYAVFCLEEKIPLTTLPQ